MHWSRYFSIVLVGLALVLGALAPESPHAATARPIAQQADVAQRGIPQSVSVVYDAARQNVVAFGGQDCSAGFPCQPLNTTWTWDRSNWSQRQTDDSPPTAGFLYYDPGRQLVTMLVRTEADLWETWNWDGGNWTRRSSTQSVEEPRLLWYGWAYDAGRDQVVLFGGTGVTTQPDPNLLNPARWSDGTIRGETWVWDGTSWTHRHPAQSPPSRLVPSMAYDAARGLVLLFGGVKDLQANDADDTWTWDGSTWTQQQPVASPSARDSAQMVYDSSQNQLVLFGGLQGFFDGTSVGGTWTWDGNAWTDGSSGLQPPLAP